MPGRPRNLPLAHENPDSEWPPETDHGDVRPFKYSFSLSHKRIDSSGWTRQVTVRELPGWP
jgi:oxalate decarboxylase